MLECRVARPERIQELDALRGVAVLAVILYHFTTRFDEFFGRVKPFFFSFPYGYLGVQLFFMISGFVIAMTLEKTPSVKKFLLNRFSRLYPSYWLAVVLTFSLVKVFHLPRLDVGWKNAFGNLTMAQSLFNIPLVDGVYWSLEIELIFYFLVAGVFFLIKPNFRETAIWFWLVLPLSWQWFINSPWGKGVDVFATVPLFLHYSPLFIAGMTYYKIWQQGLTKERSFLIISCLGVLFLMSFSFAEFTAEIIFFLAFWLMINNKLSFLKIKLLLFFGTISYPLYLIHQNVGYIIIRFLEKNKVLPILTVIVPLVITVALATAIHYCVEIPVQNEIRRRLRFK